MRIMLTIVFCVALLAPVLAHDLGSSRPHKAQAVHPVNQPAPLRQGGDTIETAEPAAIPFASTGTTAGYTNDYDEACPFDGSTSPDVVYRLTPADAVVVDIDLLGSTYDTKVYVYDVDRNLIACNDDFYPDYVSKIEQLPLGGGMTYYLVIDGYSGDFGDYVLTITEFEPCILDCPAGADLEGEPPLVDGYVDEYNGGCNTEGSTPFGIMSPFQFEFCGTSGWYLSPDGSQFRDTDWYELEIQDQGYVSITGDAEFATYMFELAPQDCASVAVVQSVTIGPCQEATMVIPGEPGDTVWFWVGPTTFDGTGEYDYVLFIDWGGCIATEEHSWSGVKSLFR